MKRKKKRSTELSFGTWLLIIAAIPFVLLHWYIDGRYEKKRQLEEQNAPALEK